MTARFQLLRAIILLLVSAFLQGMWANAMRIGSAEPNFIITFMLVAALFADLQAAPWLGFAAGLIESSFLSVYLGSFLVSRSLVAAAVALLGDRFYIDRVEAAIPVVGIGTLLADGLFYLFAPQYPFTVWGAQVLRETIYNVALAIPVFILLHRFLWRRRATLAH
ncbi:MAG: hypothetical protein M1330_00780 [Armatimonadetes bacterium]|nr:hypothetical protein [Armatimonadota bacterium]